MLKLSFALDTILGIFNQIKNGEDGTRDKGLKFLMCKLSHVYNTIVLCKVEDLLISELKKVYQVTKLNF